MQALFASNVALSLSSRSANTVTVRPFAPCRPIIDVHVTRAMTTWTLDGKGCSGIRSGPSSRLLSKKNGNCPVTPIDVSSLCRSHDGRFEMDNAVFEQEGDSLYVYSSLYSNLYINDAGIYISQLSSCSGAESTRALTVDGRPLPAHSWSKVKLRPGQIVDFGEESFQVFRQVEAHA